MKSGLPQIILIGLSEEIIQILGAFLGNKYNFIAINNNFTVNQLKSYENIILFIVNTDNITIKTQVMMQAIKTAYEIIPAIGLVHKKHYAKMLHEERNLYQDILLQPCGNEDLLTRIEVWVRTYELIRTEQSTPKTYALQTL